MPMQRWGDNVQHINQVQIKISANSVVMEESQREVGWWEKQVIQIGVDGQTFVLGRASGEGCNCLIYSFQQILRQHDNVRTSGH